MADHDYLSAPLLTIAIPTWNRADYLRRNLHQIRKELAGISPGLVNVLVSDNCSPDATPAVVEDAIRSGVPIEYLRNEENLGWARNFIQCFERARGTYVLLLGDDDFLVDGALALVMNRLSSRVYGVVSMRPFGFDEDFRLERPRAREAEREFADANRFLVATSRSFTLTSANVLNKSLLGAVDPRQFIDTDLATFHLLLRAALAAKANLVIDRYLIASKRQNSFAYEYGKVFVSDFWRIIDAHLAHGLAPETVRAIERDRLLSYYPFYVFDLRLARRSGEQAARAQFAARFGDRWLFKYWLEPTLRLPRPLAIVWGATTTLVGRVLGGDLRRGLTFARRRLGRWLPKFRTEVDDVAGSSLP